MTSHASLRTLTDADLDAYSLYIAKLAAIAAPGDPPTKPFRIWFFSHYGSFPATPLVHDHSHTLAA